MTTIRAYKKTKTIIEALSSIIDDVTITPVTKYIKGRHAGLGA